MKDRRQTAATRHAARQHGAMEFSEAPVDLDTVRRYRLERVRAELKKRDYAAAILYDQLNTRYATDVTDMQLWCLHNEARYVFVPAEGPVIVFEYGRCMHLADDIPTVDEVRPATTFFYMSAGPRYQEQARAWAAEMADLVQRYGGGNRRVAIDRMAHVGIEALKAHGIEVFDGFEVMETARAIKSPEEIVLMRCAIAVCEQGMRAMQDAMEPGITENALWSKLHETNIRLGGEWIETRLLASGPRTNPWFRECSMRPIEKGDIVSFDTDLIGPYGYCADISRAWVCGGKPSDDQKRLYSMAVEEIEHNKALIRPGATFRELAEKAWPIPDDCLPNRYSCILHGVGLCDEHPSVVHHVDYEAGKGYDGVLEEGMTVCVESFIGLDGGREGIKLEEQVLITADGVEQLSGYPLESSMM